MSQRCSPSNSRSIPSSAAKVSTSSCVGNWNLATFDTEGFELFFLVFLEGLGLFSLCLPLWRRLILKIKGFWGLRSPYNCVRSIKTTIVPIAQLFKTTLYESAYKSPTVCSSYAATSCRPSIISTSFSSITSKVVDCRPPQLTLHRNYVNNNNNIVI